MIKAICLLCLLAMQDTTAKPAMSTIDGTILTADGKPAPNMILLVQGIFPPATLRTEVRSDADGHYRVPELEPGLYALYPYDNSDQYRLRNNMFLSASPERIILKSGEHLRKDLVLPPEAGVIAGTVVSSDGLPLRNVAVVLCHADAATEVGRSTHFGYWRHSHTLSLQVNRSPCSFSSPSGLASQETNIHSEAERAKRNEVCARSAA